MRSRIMVSLIAGTIGGFLGWLFQENLVPYQAVRDVLNGGCHVVPQTTQQAGVMMLCVGGLTGLFLGAVDGVLESNRRKLLQGMLIGAVAGFVLGTIGIRIGNAVYTMLGGSDEINHNPGIFAFSRQVIARAFGWAMLGLGLGVGSALSTRSTKRIWHGAIGGFIGGFLGGFAFDLVGMTAQPVADALDAAGCREGGGPSRMIGFTAIGGLTGFFIGLVEELLKEAWVKVLAGKNEGKDFILSRPMNILGRDERSDVPLYGDNSVGPQHAAIRAENNRHVLMDANTPAGTVVNGQRVSPGGELLLRDGDMIQIGMHRILFREKATASKSARPVLDAPGGKSATPGNQVPMPSHLCPFCGAPKDASGNCLCTVAGGLPPSGAGNSPAYPPSAGWVGNAGANSGVMGAGGANVYPPGTQYPGSGAPSYGAQAGAIGGSDMPRLVGIEGTYTGEVFLLTGTNIALGRGPDRDIVLSADSTVSRNHARIANEGGDLVVYDNGSANGTYVNGMQVSMQLLVAGDIIQLGQISKFRYE